MIYKFQYDNVPMYSHVISVIWYDDGLQTELIFPYFSVNKFQHGNGGSFHYSNTENLYLSDRFSCYSNLKKKSSFPCISDFHL
jgi:hypothetical protein